jgi:signal transduction histidine kinase/ligand-binding sensor domain-containing protein
MGVSGQALRSMLLLCPCALALDPALDVSQYAHTSWKIREGFPKGTINSIAQTPDGYLWLGTEFGLLRFDGVRNVPWQPSADQHLPSTNIYSLLAARDATLWIGTRTGLASWKGGKLTQYPQLAGLVVGALLEDHEGTVWAGAFGIPAGRLCSIQKDSVHCYGEDGRFGRAVFSLYEDSKGSLWAGVLSGLWRWKPGAPQFYPLPGNPNGIQGLAEGDDGALLIATQSGVRQLVNGKIEMAHPLPGAARQSEPLKLLRDHDGNLWIGTVHQGLVHVHQGRTDVFSQSNGLSGDFAGALFEDRERNSWVATENGLDRFRDFAVAAFSGNQGFSKVGAVLAARDGSVWAGTLDGLKRWDDGQVTAYRERRSPTQAALHGVREVVERGLPDHGLSSLFQDSRGRTWISTRDGFGYLENDRFTRAGGIPGGEVHSIAEDAEGNLWIANQDLGLYRLSQDNEAQQIFWAKLGHEDHATALAADASQGGVWVGFYSGGVVYFAGGQVRASYAATEGLGGGMVNDLRPDRDGTLWAATEGGLSLLKNGRIATLTSKNGLPCDSVNWVMEDDDRAVWLNMPCGLVRIARSELDAWVADPKRTIKNTVFDSSDGVRSRAYASGYTPHVGKSPDGKLWFATYDSLSVIDPQHLPFNKLPPPVHIEAVKINGKEAVPAQGMELSHSSNDLQIDYTALSLTNPERVRFRYKLEGKDKDWQDAGTHRQAFYGGLPPKHYRFRVIARNNDGVWNEAGATWNFSIVPAFYQTLWFQALCLLAVAGLAWLLHRLRLRQVAARLNLVHKGRLEERTRLARDLHDTLLQSLAGVSLQLHGISKQAATASEKTAALIDHVREQVDSSFREVRLKVWNLRSPSLEGQGLADAIREFVDRSGPTLNARCSFNLTGQPRACTPEIEEELLRIAQEATNNANRHADASDIRIALEYNASFLTLSISDDGCGFDLNDGYRKTGHWGLGNMQERATQIRGTCTITSAPGRGTKVEVRLPLASWSLRNSRVAGTA